MTHPFRPGLEPLESRSLLVVPPGRLVPISSGLVASLAVSPAGQSEMLTMTETNVTDHDVNVAVGCGVADFWITQGNVEVWRQSRDGPQPLCPISLGGVLRPQQSRTFMATWDGHTNEASPPDPAGPFVFHGSVDGLSADSSGQQVQPPLSVTSTTDRTSYRVGQPVRITITETNVGSEAVEVGACGPDRVAVTRRGVEVWRYVNRVACIQIALLLQPGQGRQFTVTWPGRFNEHLRAPKTGLFEIQTSLAGVSRTATIRIEGGSPGDHERRPEWGPKIP